MEELLGHRTQTHTGLRGHTISGYVNYCCKIHTCGRALNFGFRNSPAAISNTQWNVQFSSARDALCNIDRFVHQESLFSFKVPLLSDFNHNHSLSLLQVRQSRPGQTWRFNHRTICKSELHRNVVHLFIKPGLKLPVNNSRSFAHVLVFVAYRLTWMFLCGVFYWRNSVVSQFGISNGHLFSTIHLPCYSEAAIPFKTDT